MRTGLLLSIILVTCIMPAACASKEGARGGNADAAALPPISVAGTWRVVKVSSLNGATERLPPTDAGAEGPTLSFDPVVGAAGGRVTIDTGVNRGKGHYVFTPGERDVGAISIDRISTTRMAGPEDAMAFEAALLKALGNARTAKRVENGLQIDCGDLRVLLTR